jgi:hypothetical protein
MFTYVNASGLKVKLPVVNPLAPEVYAQCDRQQNLNDSCIIVAISDHQQ